MRCSNAYIVCSLHDDGQVVLLALILALADEDLVAGEALLPGLLCDQNLSQHLRRYVLNFIWPDHIKVINQSFFKFFNTYRK